MENKEEKYAEKAIEISKALREQGYDPYLLFKMGLAMATGLDT